MKERDPCWDKLTGMKRICVVAAAVASVSFLGAAADGPPQAEIKNGLITAKFYLPESKRGFYRGTRFDWSGVIYSLTANGHEYYGPWFDKFDPAVHDFVYRDGAIVAGPCSAITGPVDEFGEVGYEEAAVGGTFIKIGIGALRKASDGKYDNYHVYEVANGGKWQIHKDRDGIEFIQQLRDVSSGYGYVYQKSIRLTGNKTEMLLSHTLKNTGKKAIHTKVYNHNFLVLDHKPVAEGTTISVPFAIHTGEAPKKQLAEINGQRVRYLVTLEGEEVVATRLEGFGSSPSDSQIRIEDAAAGAGMSIESDRPLFQESLWSIRSVLAMEPYTSITVEPGKEFSWTTTYEYYAILPH